MKKYFALLVALFLIIGTRAQIVDEDGEVLRVKCHAYEMMDKLILEHPELIPLIEESKAEQAAFRKNFNDNRYKKDGEVYTIPVVFHVVHNFGDENISQAQIEDAIRVMNEDFSATNLGASAVNPAFTSIVADVGIQFALAKLDPEGNCTNGIVRTVSPLTNEGGENLKVISPIWDRSRYMNIWVCRDIASGAAGYTRYPSSVSNAFGATIDGIVVRSDYVGSIGTSSPNRSHTLTHEVGHWIDLPHVWGSTNEPELESNCNTDDGVVDTPNTIGWTTCNTNGESCGSLDNVENYMEYSYCSKMFTIGQADRMIASLSSPIAERVNLWQLETLESTGVNLPEIACDADFSSNKTIICVGDGINFSDMSYNGILTRNWIFEGGSPASSTSANPVITYNSPGTYSVALLVSDGTTELSEVKTNYVVVLDTANTSLPFTEGFEAYNSFDQNQEDIWFTNNLTGGVNWEITDIAAYEGDQSAYVNGVLSNDGETEYLQSQTFDLSQLESNPIISFRYAAARRNNSSEDRLRVWVSRNCGDFWSLRADMEGDELYTVQGNFASGFTPGNESDWQERQITNLSSVFLTSGFMVRFEYRGENGNGVFIDNINIFQPELLSVENEIAAAGITLYPNPAADIVTIGWKDTQRDFSINSIALYDLSGRLVKTQRIPLEANTQQHLPVSSSELEGGVYLLRIDTNKGLITKKIVIQR